MPIFANLGFVLLNGEVSEWHSPFAVKIGYTIYLMLSNPNSNSPICTATQKWTRKFVKNE